MRSLKRSPLVRIALLSLAVLTAHTARAAKAQPIVPVRPPCPGKVTPAQPDSHKKLTSSVKRIARPGDRAGRHTLFGGPFAFTTAASTGVFYAYDAGRLTVAPHSASIPPQHLPFVLRL